MNNTSKSNSKAKLICIIAGLLVVILAIALAFTFISKPHQTKDTELTEINTKQNESYEQQTVTKDIKTNIKDSTYEEAVPEEADKTSDVEQAGDMNGDTSEGVEITDKMKEYTESQESTVTEAEQQEEWSEEPKQEEVYVPSAEPEVDNTPAPTSEPAPAPEDNSNSGLDWGSDGEFNTSGIDVDTGGYGSTGWDPAGGLNWSNQDIDWDSGGYEDTAGWTAGGTWHY